MCGRFTVQVATASLAASFGVTEAVSTSPPSFNIAPGQLVPVVVERAGIRTLDHFRWGLVPSWAKDPSIGNRLINARAETLAEKPSFRSAFARRRCLILADGFYEWKAGAGGKRPHHITLARDEAMAFAGLWERWVPPAGGEGTLSCAIVTVGANAFMADLHARMPVILPKESWGPWLDEGNHDTASLQALLVPFDGPMRAVPVSTRVNSPRNNSPECVLPFSEG